MPRRFLRMVAVSAMLSLSGLVSGCTGEAEGPQDPATLAEDYLSIVQEETYGDESLNLNDGPVLTMPHRSLQLRSVELDESRSRAGLSVTGFDVPGDDDEVRAPEGHVLAVIEISVGSGPYPDTGRGARAASVLVGRADDQQELSVGTESSARLSALVVLPEGEALLTIADQGREASFDLTTGEAAADEQSQQIAGAPAQRLDGVRESARTRGTATYADPQLAAGFGSIAYEVEVDVDGARSYRFPWVPGFGWAPKGQAWLLLAAPTTATSLTFQAGVQWTLPAAAITLTPTGGTPIRSKTGIATELFLDYFEPDTLIFALPLDATRARLRIDARRGTAEDTVFVRPLGVMQLTITVPEPPRS